jgi:hypothetical protein
MRVLLLILALPLFVFAQESFDPRRIDDSTALTYFYPTIAPENGNLWCTWAAVSNRTVRAYGRPMTLSGGTLGDVTLYDSANRDSFPCPPALSLLHTVSGGAVQMIYHS